MQVLIIIGIPRIFFKGLPGNLFDENLAGITTIKSELLFIKLFSIKFISGFSE